MITSNDGKNRATAMVFKKAIPRRTFLRGVGAALALPLLDGMSPAFASAAVNDSNAAKRLAIIYSPTGMCMDKWTPATEGAGYALTPILQPLAAYKDRMLLVSGLALRNADALLPNEGAVGNHSRASAVFLSCAHPKKTEGADLEAGTTVDQLVAREFGKKTQLPSLETAYEGELVGTCEAGYSCAYLNTISWRNPTTPMPMETEPRALFERLFGDTDSTDAATRAMRLRQNRSILDSVLNDAKTMAGGLSAVDKQKMEQYLEAVRDVERRIEMAEDQSARELPRIERPIGVPESYAEYAHMMFDMQVLAFQTDMTRVISTMLAREQSARAYPEIGVGDPHHPLTHHNGDPAKVANVLKINIFHMTQFAYFLDKMAATMDGDKSLLDRTLVMLGSAISDGNLHLHDNLPMILLDSGRIAGLKQGHHIKYPAATPLANMYMTLMEQLGMPLERLGDSTGKLPGLTA
jgi:hypothetical protein